MINIKDIDNKFLRIYRNNEEIGCLEYTLAADEAQIIDMLIKEGCRGQGYGSILLQNFVELVKDKYAQIILEVRESNLLAIHLYQKYNFKEIDLRKSYYGEPRENALVMKLTLK